MWDYQSEMEWKSEPAVKDELREQRGCASPEGAHPRRGTGSGKKLFTTTTGARLAKVLQLRASIAAGTYVVPVNELADKMLRRAQRGSVSGFGMYSV